MNAPHPPLLMTRATFAIRAFFLALFSFLTVGVGVVLIWIPEIGETLKAFDSRSRWQVALFALAQFYWALCAWFCARLVLERRCAPFEPLLPCASPRFARAVVRWTPRVVGVLATVPMAIALVRARSGSIGAGSRLVPVIVGAAFLGLVVFRRSLFLDFVDYSPDPPGVHYGYPRFDRINVRGRILIGALAAVPVAIFLLLLLDPRTVSRTLATPSLALFAVGSWNLSTGFLLIYLPLSHRRAVWTLYPLALAAVFSVWVENHNSPAGPPPAATATRPDTRPTLMQQWTEWKAALDRSECGGGQIFLVAAAGGASRAAFWTAELLTKLEQDFRKEAGGRDGCFLRNIFAISGVSGGSLGAATVVSLMADEQIRKAHAADLPETAAAFLERDMLAPVAGYLLFPDLVQRFLPFPLYWADRSRGLERTWQQDWTELEGSRWFSQPLEDLYAGDRRYSLPSLFLNTTRVADGRRVLQSNVAFTPDDTYDVFSDGFLTADLTLAGAVHNSARFLYVSPAGLVWRRNGSGTAERWGYLVDGGYFENSGAATLVPILQQIIPALGDNEQWRLSLVLISNAPSDGRSDYVCDQTPGEPGSSGVSSFLIEATAPPLALYDTRNARAHAADMTAARTLGGYVFDHMFELRLPQEPGVPPPPMTWFVSDQAGRQMIDYIDHPEQHQAPRLATNLRGLRERSTSPCVELNDRSTFTAK